MRTVFLLSSLFLCTITAQSQFETGKKLLGGVLFVNTSSNGVTVSATGTQRYTNAGISFSLQRFKSPLVVAGGGFSYSYSYTHLKDGNQPPSEMTTNSHNVGLFVNRAYLQPLARKLYLSIGGNIGGNYIYSDTKGTVSKYNESNGFSLSAGMGLGLWYQLNQRFILSGELSNLLAVSYGLSRQKTYVGTTTFENNYSSFAFTTGLSGFSLSYFGIGVKYILK